LKKNAEEVSLCRPGFTPAPVRDRGFFVPGRLGLDEDRFGKTVKRG
jgi:hypothetical protein